MEVNLKVNKEVKETVITIETNEVTDKINSIIQYLENEEDTNILGYYENEVYILKKEEIESIYTQENNVYAYYNGKEYRLKNRLYIYETLLEGKSFVKISNSELINLNKVIKVKLNIKGTLLITFQSQRHTYCSRRKIKDIKEALNIK